MMDWINIALAAINSQPNAHAQMGAAIVLAFGAAMAFIAVFIPTLMLVMWIANMIWPPKYKGTADTGMR